jgi:penicillin amidase
LFDIFKSIILFRDGLSVYSVSGTDMSGRTRVVLGVLGVVVVLAVALFFFARYQLTKSFPQISGSLALSGLLDEVSIFRDGYGVPRVVATSEHDALFALGVVHAQDRLWQMDMQRRAAEGRLSELFGTATLPFDRMFRIVGLKRIAQQIEQTLPDETRRRLQWYSDGVNAWRDQTRGAYPAEFDLLRYEPEPWTPLHTILVARLIAWELNLSWWTDITYGTLQDKLGSAMVNEILPVYPGDVPTAAPGEEVAKHAGVASGFLHTAQAYRTFMRRPLASGGSNAWALNPSRTTTGGAILVNDTHLHLTVPSQWYELQYDMPGLFVRGMSIPGVPGVVTGRNDSIAWGVTNLMADDADFFIERINDTTGTYLRGDRWIPLEVIEEEIVVRNDTTVTLRIRKTGHGPIVTDIQTPLNRVHPGFVASMQWVGAETDDQVGAFLAINKAGSWKEFLRALKLFTVPGQNFVYADTKGNIGYACGARIPIRSYGRGLLPVSGWEPEIQWTGFIPFEQLPRQYNPSSGYIASANNKVTDVGYPYVISDLWEPPSRMIRLNAVLGEEGARFSMGDCERLQNDTYSVFARDLAPLLAGVSTDSIIGAEHGGRVREYLRNWNYQFAREDIATSIVQVFMMRLFRNIYLDEMGEELFHDFTMLVNIPMRVTQHLLQGGTSPWFDDIRTPGTETMKDILRRSAREAVAELDAHFGNDTRTWRWGDLHTVTLQHPFGLQKPLDRLFNIGPFPYPGGSTALMSGEYSITDPYAVTVGASYRQLFDLTDNFSHRSILPSGQSGQVFHRHYEDQTSLWLYGGYRTVTTGTKGGDLIELRIHPPAGAQQ